MGGGVKTKTKKTTTSTPTPSPTPSPSPSPTPTSTPSPSPTGSPRSSPTIKVNTTPTSTPNKVNDGISTNSSTPSPTPYSATQKVNTRSNSVFSQSPTAVAQNNTTKAQPETFTYATTKSGNTFVIPSNLSLEARQYYAKLGVATSSQPPTEASFAVDSDTQVIVDQVELANWINENQVTQDMETQQEIGTDVQPITPDENIFTDNSIPKGDESTANGVQFGANTNGTLNTIVAEADPNWAMGQNLYTGTGGADSLSILDGSANKTDSNGQQWMTQQNQNVVPRATLESFAQNGANTTTAMMDNFKESFSKITSSKYFPFIVLGFVGLIVFSVLRGGKSGGGSSAPPVQITRYG